MSRVLVRAVAARGGVPRVTGVAAGRSEIGGDIINLASSSETHEGRGFEVRALRKTFGACTVSLTHADKVLQWLDHWKVILEVTIAGQNLALLWDIFFKHEAVHWGKLLFSFGSLLVLLAIIVMNYKTTRVKAAVPLPSSPAPPDLPIQARQIALKRIGELLTIGDHLVGQTPNNGATASDFCRFWSEQTQRWSQEVGTILTDNWGQEALNNFYSTRGLQWDQPVPRIHTEAMSNFLQINRWLQNLERLKQTLPKA
jgi:hypothetical protein